MAANSKTPFFSPPRNGGQRQRHNFLFKSNNTSTVFKKMVFYCFACVSVANVGSAFCFLKNKDRTAGSERSFVEQGVLSDALAPGQGLNCLAADMGTHAQRNDAQFQLCRERKRKYPEFGDIDGDGDLDLFMGHAGVTAASYANSYYENTGTNGAIVYTKRTSPATNPFLNLDIFTWFGSSASDIGFRPTLIDFNNDGDLDLIVEIAHEEANAWFGTHYRYWENTGTKENAVFTERRGKSNNPLYFFEHDAIRAADVRFGLRPADVPYDTQCRDGLYPCESWCSQSCDNVANCVKNPQEANPPSTCTSNAFYCAKCDQSVTCNPCASNFPVDLTSMIQRTRSIWKNAPYCTSSHSLRCNVAPRISCK